MYASLNEEIIGEVDFLKHQGSVVSKNRCIIENVMDGMTVDMRSVFLELNVKIKILDKG